MATNTPTNGEAPKAATSAKKAAPNTATSASTKPAPGFDLRKTVTDAGYIAVGLGVLGFQQAQLRRAKLAERVASATTNLPNVANVGKCARSGRDNLATVPAKVAERLGATDVSSRLRDLGDRIESARERAVERANEIGEQTRGRVAPVIDQLETRVSELPTPLPTAAAPAVKLARQLVSA